MDKYMKKSDVIAYIRKEATEAQKAFDELGGESGIIAQAFNDLANDFSQGAVKYVTAAEAFAQIPAAPVPQWISVKDRLPEPDENPVIAGCEPFNMIFMSWYDSKTKRWELPSKFACEVTHWMLTSSLPRMDGAEADPSIAWLQNRWPRRDKEDAE